MAVVINVTGSWNDKDIKKAQDDLAKLGRTTKETGAQASGSFKDMAGSAKLMYATLAGAAVGKFAVDSVKAFAEAEQSQARLSAAYEKFPALADANIDALRDLDSELQRKTRFDDDATAAAQASLAQFQLTGQQIAEITPLVQDFATATGQDVVAAADSLGKAFLGNTRALKAVGIDFKATGDRAQDFATITAALRKQVGGLAENEGKTAAGQLAILQNAYGDLQESVGESLMPALQSLANIMTPIVRLFGALPAPVRTVALAVGLLGGAFVVLGPKIRVATQMIRTFGTEGLGASKKVRAIGAAGTAAAVGLTVFMTAQSNAQAAAQSFSDTLDQQTGALTSETTKHAVEEFVKNFSLDDLKNTPFTIEQITSAVAAGGPAYDDLRAKVKAWGEESAKAAGVQLNPFDQVADKTRALDNSIVYLHDDLTRGQDIWKATKAGLDAAADATANVGDLSEYAARGIAKLPPPLDLAKEGAKKLTAAWKALDGALGKQDAKDQAVRSLKELASKLGETGGALKGNSDKALDNREALRGAIGDIAAYAQSFKNPTKQINALNDETGKIRKTLLKNGVKPADVDKYLGPLMNMKGKATTAGEDIAEGLAQGIINSRAVAIREAEAMGAAAVAAVRRGADAHSPSRYTFKVGQDIVAGLSDGVLKDAGGARKVIRDSTRQALDAARDELQKFQGKGKAVLDFINSIKGNITSFGAVTGFTGSDQQANAANIITSMQGRVAEAKRFADAIGKLRGMKLNNASLQEIISAGPHDGLAIADALLKGGAKAIGQVNSLESQLNLTASRIGDTASLSQYGMTATQATGMTQTNVHIEKGAVVVQVPDTVRASDAAAIERSVDRAMDKAVRQITRELARSHK